MIIRGHAEEARRNFLLGSCIYDAYTTFMGLEAKDTKLLIKEVAKIKALHPAAAAFDAAQARDKL